MEKTNNIISNHEYYAYEIYDFDNNNVIYREETIKENIASSFVYLLFLAIISFVTMAITLNTYKESKIQEKINLIIEQCKPEDLEILRKKLLIYKSNYERLCR